MGHIFSIYKSKRNIFFLKIYIGHIRKRGNIDNWFWQNRKQFLSLSSNPSPTFTQPYLNKRNWLVSNCKFFSFFFCSNLGQHPSVEGSISNVTGCVRGFLNNDTCLSSFFIQIKKCSGFFVYNLPYVDLCFRGYCFGKYTCKDYDFCWGSLNNDDQQFLHYQQNEQSPLASTHWT